MFKKIFLVLIPSLIFLTFLLSAFSSVLLAQENEQQPLVGPSQEEIVKAQVLMITNEGQKEILGKSYPFQEVKFKILEGTDSGKEVTINHGERFSVVEGQKVKVGETIVVVKLTVPIGEETQIDYQIIDKYRLPQIVAITLVFALLVLALSRLKGLGSLVGLAISLLVIVKFIVPQILAGRPPLPVVIVGSIFIMLTTIYLAHGFSKRTTIALVSTTITLVIVGLLSVTFVKIGNLSGLGNEDANALRFGQQTAGINFQGLFLGGIIIGALGVLDDITTSLSTAIFELKKANIKLKFKQLVSSGMAIGREHISSLVNTLLLAYAGASLPIFLFIVINPTKQPLWFILNSEIIVEEVVRTLAGSFGLVLAVPITCLLAAWVFSLKQR